MRPGGGVGIYLDRVYLVQLMSMKRDVTMGVVQNIRCMRARQMKRSIVTTCDLNVDSSHQASGSAFSIPLLIRPGVVYAHSRVKRTGS